MISLAILFWSIKVFVYIYITKDVPIQKIEIIYLLWLGCFLIKKVVDENNVMPLSIQDLNALIMYEYDGFHTTKWEMSKLTLPTHKNEVTNSIVLMNSLTNNLRKFIPPPDIKLFSANHTDKSHQHYLLSHSGFYIYTPPLSHAQKHTSSVHKLSFLALNLWA